MRLGEQKAFRARDSGSEQFVPSQSVQKQASGGFGHDFVDVDVGKRL